MRRIAPTTSDDGGSEDATILRVVSTSDSLHDPADSPHKRRWALFVFGAAVAIGLAFALLHGIGGAVFWLQDQTEYKVAFEDITLYPPPPSYIKGGAATILAAVRKSSGLPTELAALRQDWGGVARAFALSSPWVERVRSVRVEGYPTRIIVNLDYRRPLAFLIDDHGRRIDLDQDGVVLPGNDIDLTAVPHAIEILRYADASEPVTGLVLVDRDTDAGVILFPALALARFLSEQSWEGLEPEHRVRFLSVKNAPSWLSIQTVGGLRIVWGHAPGDEPTGTPDAAQKWRWLSEWLRQERLNADEVGHTYLVLTRDGLVVNHDPPSG